MFLSLFENIDPYIDPYELRDIHGLTFLFWLLQPETVTGDIVFVLQQKDHPKFKRKGDDLFYEHALSLTEALCGFRFVLTHLDNRQLLIKSNPGEVVKPGKQSKPSCRKVLTFSVPGFDLAAHFPY